MAKKILYLINDGLKEPKYNSGIYNIMYNDLWFDNLGKILVEFNGPKDEFETFEKIQIFIFNFNKNFKSKYLLKYDLLIIDNLSRMTEREIVGLARIYNLVPKEITETYIRLYPSILKECIEWMFVSPIFKQILNYEMTYKNSLYERIKKHH
uniref:Uncharacterized protein n=1 Tax=viral metagenome TaxID=1070528 RepID=A0A6C0ETB3_9ZZZZ